MSGSASRSSSRRAGLAVVAAATLAGWAAWTWPLATHLSTHIPVRESPAATAGPGSFDSAGWDLILANDQNLSLWGSAANSRAVLRGDWRALLFQGQCFPMPKATALGEHMIELGVLALPAMAATGDPVVSYNFALLAALLAASSGMFLFLAGLGLGMEAAVLGALAFAFSSPRLLDLPYHPAVVGTHWIPWVLWSFDRVLSGGGKGSLVAFATTLLLAALVGSYPMMAVALFAGVYGCGRVAGAWRRGDFGAPLLAKLCAAASLPAAAAALLLLFYSAVLKDWLLSTPAEGKFLVGAIDYLPGGLLSAGSVSLLGIFPLFLLRRGAGREAALPLLVATFFTLVFATRIPLPGGSTWDLYESLAAHIPLLASVRSPGKIGLAVVLGLQALGAIGWNVCFEALGRPFAAGIAALLVAFLAVEASPPSWARSVLGSGAVVELREVALSPSRLEVLTAAFRDPSDRRAVLDLPTGRMVKAPAALLDAAWHDHPTSACYNSLIPPTMREVYALAARSHGVRGLRELAAAGFAYVIERPTSKATSLSPTSFPEPAHLVSFDPGVAVWSLPHPGTLHHDASRLLLKVAGGATRSGTFAPEPPNEIDVEVTNRDAEMWAAPQPLAPLLATVELLGADGTVVFHSRARGILPLALAGGATTTVQLVMAEAPAPGTYRATIAIETAAEVSVDPAFHWINEAH